MDGQAKQRLIEMHGKRGAMVRQRRFVTRQQELWQTVERFVREYGGVERVAYLTLRDMTGGIDGD